MDFTSIFNGEAITLEQFTERTKAMKLADLATGDYVDRNKYKDDLRKANDRADKAEETIKQMQESNGDVEAMKKQLEEYQKADEARKQAEKEAAARAEMLDRFNRAKGENVFSSEYAESGVLEAFSKAVSDPANKGRGDNEIFSDLTKDKEGVFKSKNPPANMGGIGSGVIDEAPKTLAAALHERYNTKG